MWAGQLGGALWPARFSVCHGLVTESLEERERLVQPFFLGPLRAFFLTGEHGPLILV